MFIKHNTGQQQNIFVKRPKMLNRFVVKWGTLSLKMHLSFSELALVLDIFLLLFFYNFVEHGAFSSMRNF